MKCAKCKRGGLPKKGKKKFCPACMEDQIVTRMEVSMLVSTMRADGHLRSYEVKRFFEKMLKDLRKNSVPFMYGEPHVISEPMESMESNDSGRVQ